MFNKTKVAAELWDCSFIEHNLIGSDKNVIPYKDIILLCTCIAAITVPLQGLLDERKICAHYCKLQWISKIFTQSMDSPMREMSHDN